MSLDDNEKKTLRNAMNASAGNHTGVPAFKEGEFLKLRSHKNTIFRIIKATPWGGTVKYTLKIIYPKMNDFDATQVYWQDGGEMKDAELIDIVEVLNNIDTLMNILQEMNTFRSG